MKKWSGSFLRGISACVPFYENEPDPFCHLHDGADALGYHQLPVSKAVELPKLKLDEKIAERLAGMNLTEEATSGDIPESILVGRILDQAALNGVMHTLYELHRPLILDCLDF